MNVVVMALHVVEDVVVDIEMLEASEFHLAAVWVATEKILSRGILRDA